MRYEEVYEYLIKEFPDFVIDEVSQGLPYCVAGDFAHYLLNAYKNNEIDTLISAGKFIENLYSYENDEIKNLATVGYLESIQNVWSHYIDPEDMVKYLGETSKKWWERLNRLWNGDATALSEEVHK